MSPRRPVARSARRGGHARSGVRRARRARPRCARARQDASPPGTTGRRPAARGGDGSKTWGTSVWRTRSRCSSSSMASSTSRSAVAAAAAASSGSNGSPTTAAPSRTRRARGERHPSSSARASATPGGTSCSANVSSRSSRNALGTQPAGELLEVERVAAALVVQGGRGAPGRPMVRGTRPLRPWSSPSRVMRVRVSVRCARSSSVFSAAAAAQGGPRVRSSPGVGGLAKQRSQGARRRRGRPSERRRGSAPAARSTSAVPGAPGPRGARGNARAGRRRRSAEGDNDGKTLPSWARTSGSRRSRRRGSRPRTKSSRALTNTQNGRSPRVGGEARENEISAATGAGGESASSRVLPMPGSPTSSTAFHSPRLSSARAPSRSASSSARPTSGAVATPMAFLRV